jgi:hypothetical protein
MKDLIIKDSNQSLLGGIKNIKIPIKDFIMSMKPRTSAQIYRRQTKSPGTLCFNKKILFNRLSLGLMNFSEEKKITARNAKILPRRKNISMMASFDAKRRGKSLNISEKNRRGKSMDFTSETSPVKKRQNIETQGGHFSLTLYSLEKCSTSSRSIEPPSQIQSIRSFLIS